MRIGVLMLLAACSGAADTQDPESNDSGAPDDSGRDTGEDTGVEPAECAAPAAMVYGVPLPHSEAEADELVAYGVDNGIGTFVPSVGGTYVLWQTGHGTYDPAYQALLDAGTDSLALLIDRAHTAGIDVYPSVTVYGAAHLADHPGWITHDRDGNAGDSTALAFSDPDARAAHRPLFLDLVCNYDIDGIFLDYARYPTPDHGFDPPILAECIDEHGFDPRAVDKDSAEYAIFEEIRARGVTAYVSELRSEALACNPDLRIGGFGDGAMDLDADDYGRDLAAWAAAGAVDDVFLATYIDPIPTMRHVVADARQRVGPDVRLLSALCVYAGILGTDSQVERAARELLVGGSDGLWFYRDDYLRELGLSPTAGWVTDLVRWAQCSDDEAVLEWSAADGLPSEVGWNLTGTAMTLQGDRATQAGGGAYVSPALDVDWSGESWAVRVRARPLDDLGDTRSGAAVRWGGPAAVLQFGLDRAGGLAGGTGGALMVEYDASTVTAQRPDEVSPGWAADGDAASDFATDEGDYLFQNFGRDTDPVNGGDYGGWLSPTSDLKMRAGAGGYRVEVEVQPLDDFTVGSSYDCPNIVVAWADDTRTFIACFDRDTSDSGGTNGTIATHTLPMTHLVTGIDWSLPRSVGFTYRAAEDAFDIDIDGLAAATVTADALASGHYAPWQDRVYFGDATTGGNAPDYDAHWYAVRGYALDPVTVAGIDWSTPRVVRIAGRTDDDYVYVSVDGVLHDAVAAASFTIGTGGTGDVAFGDLSGSAALAAEWYALGVYRLTTPPR